MLHFLPDTLILWFCNLLLLTGVVLTIAGFFIQRIPVPLLWQYQLPFKIVGVVLLVAGVYFRGGYGVEMAWRERVAEVEAKLKIAQEKSVEANTQIDAKAQKQVTRIRERMTYVNQYVDREVVKYNDQCTSPQAFVDAHNLAAEAPPK